MGHKWILGCKSGLEWVGTHFFPLSDPSEEVHKSPSLNPIEGWWTLFSERGPEAALTKQRSKKSPAPKVLTRFSAFR